MDKFSDWERLLTIINGEMVHLLIHEIMEFVWIKRNHIVNDWKKFTLPYVGIITFGYPALVLLLLFISSFVPYSPTSQVLSRIANENVAIILASFFILPTMGSIYSFIHKDNSQLGRIDYSQPAILVKYQKIRLQKIKENQNNSSFQP
jgi:hypothetical protein